MRNDLKTYLEELKSRGLSPEREARLRAELESAANDHDPPFATAGDRGPFAGFSKSIYAWHDLAILQGQPAVDSPFLRLLKSLDDLLERDSRREQDGFPRKIRVGRLVKPGRGGKGKVVVVPTTEEEKFYHDPTVRPPGEGGESGGSGAEEEGEILGEQPVRPEGEQSGAGRLREPLQSPAAGSGIARFPASFLS